MIKINDYYKTDMPSNKLHIFWKNCWSILWYLQILLAWHIFGSILSWLVLNSIVRVYMVGMDVVPSISFQPFFVQAFKIVVDSGKFTILLLYILWDDWPIFMISASNEQLQQQLEYTLLKPDCHSWWIFKMQSGREDTLEEWYAIKFCFKPGKNATNVWNASDCFSTILHESSISFWVA